MSISRQLRDEIRARRVPKLRVDGKDVPGSIPFLIGLLSTVSDANDRDDLLGELAGEYLRAGMEPEHLVIQRERVSNRPDDALSWIGLAQTLSATTEGANEARESAARGVEISRRSGALVRFALVCQADVARRIGDSALFECVLEQLIVDAPNRRDGDCDLNDDLVADLPEGFCSKDVERRYRELLASEQRPGTDYEQRP